MGNCTSDDATTTARTQADRPAEVRPPSAPVLPPVAPPVVHAAVPKPEVIPEDATSRISIIPLRNRFASDCRAQEAITFFKDEYDVTVYKEKDAVYQPRDPRWTFLCTVADYNMCLADKHRHHLGHTEFILGPAEPSEDRQLKDLHITLQLPERSESMESSHSFSRSEIMQRLSDKLQEHSSGNSDHSFCWRVSVSPHTPDAPLGTHTFDDVVVKVDVAPSHVLIQLVPVNSSQPISSRDMDSLAETFIRVLHAEKGATVTRFDKDPSLLICPSTQELGTLHLGDDQSDRRANQILVKNVWYRCIRGVDPADAVAAPVEKTDADLLLELAQHLQAIKQDVVNKEVVLVVCDSDSAFAAACSVTGAPEGPTAGVSEGLPLRAVTLPSGAVALVWNAAAAVGAGAGALALQAALKGCSSLHVACLLSVPMDGGAVVQDGLRAVLDVLHPTAEAAVHCSYWLLPSSSTEHSPDATRQCALSHAQLLQSMRGDVALLQDLCAKLSATENEHVKVFKAGHVVTAVTGALAGVLMRPAVPPSADLFTSALTSTVRVDMLRETVDGLHSSITAALKNKRCSPVAQKLAQLRVLSESVHHVVCHKAYKAAVAEIIAGEKTLLEAISDGIAERANGTMYEIPAPLLKDLPALVQLSAALCPAGSNIRAVPPFTLAAYVTTLQARVAASELSVTAAAEEALKSLEAPMALVSEICPIYAAAQSAGKEDVIALSAALENIEREYKRKVSALESALVAHFSGDAVTTRLNPATTWWAVELCKTLGKPAVPSNFILEHEPALSKALDDAYETVLAPVNAVRDTDRTSAAQKMLEILKYLQSFEACYCEHQAEHDAVHGPGSLKHSRLVNVVFHGSLTQLHLNWVGAANGKILQKLQELQRKCAANSATTAASFAEVAHDEWTARCLLSFDAVLPTGEVQTTFASVHRQLAERMKTQTAPILTSIQAMNVDEIVAFFAACDLGDAKQAAALVNVRTQLTAAVETEVSRAETQITTRLNLATIADDALATLLTDCAKVQRMEPLCPYVLPPTASAARSVQQRMHTVRDAVLTAAQVHATGATAAMNEGRFADGEAALQRVERTLVALFGSVEAYQTWFRSNNSAPGSKERAMIDPVACRNKVSAYVAAAQTAYAAAFAALEAELTASTEPTTPFTPPRKTGTGKESPHPHSPLSSGKSSGGTKSVVKPADPVGAVLQRCFAEKSPSALVSALNAAASVNAANSLYTTQAKSLCTFLTSSLNTAAARCGDDAIALDVRHQLRGALQAVLSTLPADVSTGLSPALDRHGAVIAAKFAEEQDKLESALPTITRTQLIDALQQHIAQRRYIAATNCKAAIAAQLQQIAAMLQNGMPELEQLQMIIDQYRDWCMYFELCDDLCVNSAYVASLDAKDQKFSAIADEANLDALRGCIESVAAHYKGKFAAVQTLAAKDSAVFMQAAALVQAAIVLQKDVFYCPEGTTLPWLGERLQSVNGWPQDTIQAFFQKVVDCFRHYNGIVAGLLTADPISPAALKVPLDALKLSGDLHATICCFEFEDQAPAQAIPALRQFGEQCRSYDATANDTVAAALKHIVEVVKSKTFLHNTELSGADADIRTAYYERVATHHNVLLAAQTELAAHLPVGILAQRVSDSAEHLQAEVKHVHDYLMDDVLRDSGDISEEYQKEYNVWYDNLRAFNTAFPTFLVPPPPNDVTNGTAVTVVTYMTAVRARLMSIVEAMINAALGQTNNNELTQQILTLKSIAENIAEEKEVVDKKVDTLLTTLKTQPGGSQRMLQLGALLNRAPGELGKKVLKEHDVFDGYRLHLFNTKTHRFTFQQVLQRTAAEVELGERPIDQARMLEQHALFEREYRDRVKEGLGSLESTKDACVTEARQIAANSNMAHDEQVRGLLVRLFVYWTLSNSQHYFETEVNGTASTATTEVNAAEVGAGAGAGAGAASAEGGDCTTATATTTTTAAAAATVTAPAAVKHDASSMYLKQPHPGQLIALFRMFGLDQPNCHKPRSQVKIMNHFVQVSTGEGKSVILAMTSSVFALLGKTVQCACYSEYLSGRDLEGFQPLFGAFGIAKCIKYGTFQQLCELYLNSTVNIREAVAAVMQRASTPEAAWHRGDAAPTHFPVSDTVLLIDEVDVFFQADFYGSNYRPVAALRDAPGETPVISNLIDFIWNSRPANCCVVTPEPTPNPHKPISNLTFKKVQKSEPYQACLRRYAAWEYFIEEAVKQLVNDLKTFEVPDVERQIIVDYENHRIGYKVQDKISYQTRDSYKTLFAYYKAHFVGQDGKHIHAAALSEVKCLSIDCGIYSFAEVPKIYNTMTGGQIMGVSGTLRTLRPELKRVLRDQYHIEANTYTASVYDDKTGLVFEDSQDVQIVDAADHFAAITAEIHKRRKQHIHPPQTDKPPVVSPAGSSPAPAAGSNGAPTTVPATLLRPVLVFFPTSEELHRYKAQLRPGEFAGGVTEVLTEATTGKSKDTIIGAAGSPGAVTLLSRELGRGTDFQVFNDLIDQVGGVHVMTTFLPADESELRQIQGRTARQGNRGSYSMVLTAEHLAEAFDVTSDEIAAVKRTGQYKALLDHKRDIKCASQHDNTERRVAELKGEYETAMKFVAALAKVPTSSAKNTATVSQETKDTIITYLKTRNVSGGEVSTATLSRTLVLMDATNSMGPALQAAKEKVRAVFDDIGRVFSESPNMANARYEVQFGVYRNYDSGVENVLQVSNWKSDPADLQQFMAPLQAEGGVGKGEAIELALQHANRQVAARGEGERYQVIIIGDAPPNCYGTSENADDEWDVSSKDVESLRYAYGGEELWSASKFGPITIYTKEADKLADEDVPIHTFPVPVGRKVQKSTQYAFEEISKRTKGICEVLDVTATTGADNLKRVITERILDDVGGGGEASKALLERYRTLFPLATTS